MAVFICECCGATLKKQQVDKHCVGKCANAWQFTCVECMTTLEGFDYQDHNECMTEVQKFQGKFIEKQRQEKLKSKENKKSAKTEPKVEETKEASKKAGDSISAE